MSTFITNLNSFSPRLIALSGSLVWQSSVLIIFLFLLDLALRHRVRAALRYGLWMLLLVKLILPPAFALPTGPAYWLSTPKPPASAVPKMVHATVSYADVELIPGDFLPATPLPAPTLSLPSWLFVAWLAGASGLLLWVFQRSRLVSRLARRGEPATPALLELLDSCRIQLGIRKTIQLRVSGEAGGPSVCGGLKPVILIPEKLADRLSALQMRAVLLHELVHIQRGDVWVNYAQTVWQIVYWFHPLLWLANAHIRRVREEVVDETVMIELRAESEQYPATLLEVAKLAFTRPFLTLGLIGIMESKSALKQRMQRLLDRPIPKSAKLDFVGFISILIVAAALLPMARGQRNVSPPAISSIKAAPPLTTVPQSVEEDAAEMGKSDEGEVRLKEILRINPANMAAAHELNILMEKRSRRTVQLRESTAKKEIWQAEKAWMPDAKGDLLPIPNPAAPSNLVHTSPGRQDILNKLDKIRMNEVIFDGIPLVEVLKKIRDESIQRDPGKKGVDFGTVPNISTVKITMIPALVDLRLGDVLDLIVKGADQPIKYTIEDYAVMFSPKPEAGALYTRVFKVNPSLLARAIENSSSTTSTTNRSATVYQNLLGWFRAGGIILDPPKAVFYSDGRGNLMIRATLEDFKKVETLLTSALQTDVAQILIEAKFVAANQDAANLDLLRISAGRVPSITDQNVTVISVSPIVSGPAYSVNVVGYVSRKSEARISMLTAAQKTNWLRIAEKVAGCDVLSAPRISTLTGRPAKITVTTAETIDGKQYSFGPTLDVLPTLRNGIIDLEVTATMSEKEPSQTNKPKIRTSEITGRFLIEKDGAAVLSGPEFKAPDGRGYYIVISARQIDSAGNPVDP